MRCKKMAETSKSMLPYIAMVAIVAIVGIVVMISNGGKQATQSTLQLSEGLDANTGGQGAYFPSGAFCDTIYSCLEAYDQGDNFYQNCGHPWDSTKYLNFLLLYAKMCMQAV